MTYEEWYVKNNIIHESKYKDFKIIIVRMIILNIRTWECAYVIFPKNYKHLLKYDFIYDNDDLYTVHGGFTFQEEFGIGWDYAHLNDLDRHYTLNEIRNDAYSVIDQLEGRKKMNYQEREDILEQKLKCEETLILQNKCSCCGKSITYEISPIKKREFSSSFTIKLREE